MTDDRRHVSIIRIYTNRKLTPKQGEVAVDRACDYLNELGITTEIAAYTQVLDVDQDDFERAEAAATGDAEAADR